MFRLIFTKLSTRGVFDRDKLRRTIRAKEKPERNSLVSIARVGGSAAAHLPRRLSVQQKAASLSTFRVLARTLRFAFAYERVVEEDGRIHDEERLGARGEERRKGLERSQPFGGWRQGGGGGGGGDGGYERRDGPGSYGHYIPNRKRDKANKTLSGRRSANRTPW